jgi:2-dehydropantoate 2-reductase
MKIAVLGAGAIGGLVAGYLKLKNEDVCLIGQAGAIKAIKENGLAISGVRGNFNIKIAILEKLDYKPDLLILDTKTQDIDLVLNSNLEFIQGIAVVTTQNGIQADNIAVKYVPRENIISSIIMFGSTYLEPGKIVHNFEGSWILSEAVSVLNKAFTTIVTQDMQGMKYLKIFVNANNCIPAILGLSMQDTFKDVEMSNISINIWREGLDIVSKAGIKLVSLPGFPTENITKLTSIPTSNAAKIFSGIMSNLSKEPLYGSILQSIKRGRSSEIDYINGEFINLAEKNNINAPLNRKLVEMVHEVEKKRRFFSKEELLNNMKGLVN